MSKNKLGGDLPGLKFIQLKIRRRDGVESLMTFEKGEFNYVKINNLRQLF